MNPFQFTEITKRTVTKNMYDLLYNYLSCEEFENVVLTHSWHGERIERGIENTFSFYAGYAYSSVDTTDVAPDEVAEKIFEIMQSRT